MKVLAIDIGGTNVKMLLSGEAEERRFPSGPAITAQEVVDGVKRVADGWLYEAVSMGYPGPVVNGMPEREPMNLGGGWIGYDFERAFGCPVRIVNDAAMQALGSYRGGRMLFLGLGTGMGSAMISNGVLEPMELAHLPFRKATYEDYVGVRGLERMGKKKWRKRVVEVVAELVAALEPDDVVLGGGNVKKLDELPPGCRAGDNANAFIGAFRLWDGHENGASS
jgi:polyphosphate glucokinase